MVVPGSSTVKRQAEAAGLDRVFRDAGFFWGEVRLLHVRRQQRRPRRARRALHVHRQPQFREPPGHRRPHPFGGPAMAAAAAVAGPHRRCAPFAWRSGVMDALHPPHRHRRAAAARRRQHRRDHADRRSRAASSPTMPRSCSCARACAPTAADPDFVFNRPQFRRPGILVSGRNFGCGSSRESAVWAMLAVGIRCIIAQSLADIYRENCLQNGVLPVELAGAETPTPCARASSPPTARAPFTVDLVTQRIGGPGGADIGFDIPAVRPHAPARRPRRYRPDPQIRGRDRRLRSSHRAAQPWLQRARGPPRLEKPHEFAHAACAN